MTEKRVITTEEDFKKLTGKDLFDDNIEFRGKAKELIDGMNDNATRIIQHEAKKGAQPFITNTLLEDIQKNQTPLWINYTILGVAILTLIVTLLIGMFKP